MTGSTNCGGKGTGSPSSVLFCFSLKHTQRVCKEASLVGWVKNTPRGTVTGVIQGDAARVQQM